MKLCSKCKVNEACPNHAYCRPCQRIYEDARRTKPKKFIRRPNSDSDLCPKCLIRTRLPYHGYCDECKKESTKDWLKSVGGTWNYYSGKGKREMMVAHAAVARAIKNGTLVKPLECQDCGEIKSLEGHHYMGYSKPFRLVVRWLCSLCHDKAHKIIDKSLLT